MKKVLSVILSLCMLFSVTAGAGLTAFADVDGDFEFDVVSGSAVVTKYNGTATDLVLPDTLNGAPVSGVGSYAFNGCSTVTSVAFPNTLTSIGEGAFLNCTALKTVIVHATLTDISSDAFYGCPALTAFTVDAGNPQYIAEDGILYDTLKTVIVHYPAGSAKTGYDVPDTVISIADGQFYGCKNLTEINIPDSVVKIGNSAFRECSALEKINLPSSVQSVGVYAFKDCASLTSAEIPGGVTRIANGTFSGCSSLTSFAVPDNVVRIGEDAFSGCTSLAQITIPESIKSIGEGAFDNCSGLKTVNYEGTVAQWEKINIGKSNVSAIKTGIQCKDGKVGENKNSNQNGTDNQGNNKSSNKTNTPENKPVALKKTQIKKLIAGAKRFTVRWKRVKGVDGYQIQYSLKKNMKKAKKKNVKGAKKTKITIKKNIKKNKKYYVRIRTYKVINGEKEYSKWSKKKAVKVK